MATASASQPVSKRSLFFLDVIGEKNQRLPPIHGYEDKELVSLENAIAPVKSLVPHVEKMVAFAKEGNIKSFKNLSVDQLGSIRLYTLEWEPREKSFFYILNQALRAEERDKIKPWFSFLKLIMTALRQLPSISTKVYRGVKDDLSGRYSEGTIFTWWGFSSCTTHKDVLEGDQFLGTSGKRTMFVINCKSGKDIRELSFYRNEFEVLLLPSTRFRVTKCSTLSNLTTIELEELQSESASISFPERNQYTNPILEKVLNECDSGASIELTYGNLTDSDLWIVIDQGLNRKQCVELNLSKNSRISPDGILAIGLALKTNTTLQNFSLTQSRKFSDESVEALVRGLRSNHYLRILDLSYNAIKDEGAKHLAELLKVNHTLHELYLTKNQIHNQGVQQLAAALEKSNTTLQQLSLDYNPIADECVNSLIAMLGSNRTLKRLQILNTTDLSADAKARLRENNKERVK